MALNDLQVKRAKAGAKPYKLADGGGLHLVVTPAGGKLWRLKYRFAGKEKLLSIGQYPAVTLAAARKTRDAAKAGLAEGMDPAVTKWREKARAHIAAGDTFDCIAGEYIDKRKADGKRPYAKGTAERAERFRAQLAPALGRMPVTAIEPADILAALRPIERRGNLESARRALQFASQVMRHAVATARLASDPTRDLKGALATPETKHHAAIIDAKELGGLLRAMDSYKGNPVTLYALQLSPHVFVRPGELRHAEWAEIDLERAVWSIPASKTKMRKPHAVPLSRQAVAVFRALQEVTGPDGYCFPGLRSRSRPMSENTVNAALRRLGYSGDEMTGHGFRSTASTLLNESGKWHPDAIERALAHGDSNEVRGVYARGQWWNERVKMAQWWSDHLDTLRKGADIIPMPGKGAA